MNKAAALLAREPETTKKVRATEPTPLPLDTQLRVPTYGRKASARAVARLYRLKARLLKTAQTEADALKDVLRNAGQEWLDTNAEAGRYYGSAAIDCVRVSRANRYAPVPYPRDDLMDAVGAENYRIMFSESGTRLEFDNIDAMRHHLALCKVAGVPMVGKPVEAVTPTPRVAEHIARVGDVLDEDRRELLRRCAKDQTARVLVK
jgi:hypothetical protein